MSVVENAAPTDHRAVWNTAFGERPGLLGRCPYDYVASFLFRFAPSGAALTDVSVLEVGFGGGANLWFAARQGFRVAGIDVSDHAVEAARAMLDAEGLDSDLRRAAFTALPFDDATFDLAFDRCALTYASPSEARVAVAEIRRVLRPGGRLLFNPYSDQAGAASGPSARDGRGAWSPVAGRADVRFYGREDIEALLDGWKILEIVHAEEVDHTTAPPVVRAQWRVVAERP
jgi:SAM-dependent methyltransferase